MAKKSGKRSVVSSRSTKASKFLKELASEGARSALASGLNASLPGAGTALRTAMSIAKTMSSRSSRSGTRSTVSNRNLRKIRRPYTLLGSVNKFKKPKKKVTIEEKFGRTGYVQKHEVSGTQSGTDCVYIGHSSYCIDDLQTVIWGCLVRKLFKKAGIDLESTSAVIPGFAGNFFEGDTAQWRIQLARLNKLSVSPNANNFQYDILATDSIRTVASQLVSASVPMYGTQGASATNQNTEPLFLNLYVLDTSTINTFKLKASMNLVNEIIHIYGKSTLKIQNRTTAVGDGATDVVTRNPLVGRRYHFNSGVPHQRNADIIGICYMSTEEGIMSKNQSAINVTGGREPPVRSVFTNCTKHVGVKIDPGEIKYGSVYHTWSGTLLKYYKHFRRDTSAESDPAPGFQSRLYYYPGKSEMYALEDSINLNNDVTISVAFEVQREVGAYSRTIKKSAILADYRQTLNVV